MERIWDQDGGDLCTGELSGIRSKTLIVHGNKVALRNPLCFHLVDVPLSSPPPLSPLLHSHLLSHSHDFGCRLKRMPLFRTSILSTCMSGSCTVGSRSSTAGSTTSTSSSQSGSTS